MRATFAAVTALMVMGTTCYAASDLVKSQVADGHKLEISPQPGGRFQVLMDGKPVYSGEGDFPFLRPPATGGGQTYIIVEEGSGGTACPSLFRAIDVSGPQPVVSPELGNCSDIPEIAVKGGVLQMSFPRSRDAPAQRPTFDGSRSQGAVGAPSPETFVRSLYAGYVDTPGAPIPNLLGAKANQIFDPELVALLRRSDVMARAGTAQLITVDPICDCQDWEKLTINRVDVAQSGQNQATAKISFTNTGRPDTITYQLVNIAGQWRVHDIQGPNMPSFKQYLVAGLARASKGRG